MTGSFDVYRRSPIENWSGNLWWFCGGTNGNPTRGGQYNWDLPLTSRTYPFIDDEYDPWVETRFEAWTAVRLTWDFGQGLASGFYDGVLVSTKEIVSMDSFYAYTLDMDVGGAPQDFHEEWAWIDNFIITAEKSRCYPDCDGGGGLDLFDFLCFVNLFNAQDGNADCDGNGSFDLFDFLCFVNAFNQGC